MDRLSTRCGYLMRRMFAGTVTLCGFSEKDYSEILLGLILEAMEIISSSMAYNVLC
jgi:hypothetical protein